MSGTRNRTVRRLRLCVHGYRNYYRMCHSQESWDKWKSWGKLERKKEPTSGYFITRMRYAWVKEHMLLYYLTEKWVYNTMHEAPDPQRIEREMQDYENTGCLSTEVVFPYNPLARRSKYLQKKKKETNDSLSFNLTACWPHPSSSISYQISRRSLEHDPYPFLFRIDC